MRCFLTFTNAYLIDSQYLNPHYCKYSYCAKPISFHYAHIYIKYKIKKAPHSSPRCRVGRSNYPVCNPAKLCNSFTGTANAQKHWQIFCSWALHFPLVIRVEVDHPFNAIFVSEHTKPGTPGTVGHRHFNISAGRKSRK